MKNKIKLTKEEKEFESAIEKGEYVSVYKPTLGKEYAAFAKQTFAKQRTVNLRITERNLLRLKAAAAREGVSYQTFITSIIQKHV